MRNRTGNVPKLGSDEIDGGGKDSRENKEKVDKPERDAKLCFSNQAEHEITKLVLSSS